jgi:CRP-like cAMP-binding protein
VNAAQLQQISVFAELDDDERRRIAELCQQVDLPPYTMLAKSGEFGYRFFAVLEGTASVQVGGEEIAVLGAGDFFGEMALLEEERRTADVRATSPMTLLTMMTWDFNSMMEDFPAIAAKVRATVEARRSM